MLGSCTNSLAFEISSYIQVVLVKSAKSIVDAVLVLEVGDHLHKDCDRQSSPKVNTRLYPFRKLLQSLYAKFQIVG